MVTSFNHNLKTYNCNQDGTIRISSLLQLFQEGAYISAENLGFGYNRMQELNRYWVLANIRLEFEKPVSWPGEIQINTWPSGRNRIYATREFLVKDLKQNVMVRGSSNWFTLDIETHKPLSLSELDELNYMNEKATKGEVVRVTNKNGAGEKIGRFIVPNSAIDLNGHVNNTEYVRWCIDALHQSNNHPEKIKGLSATFMQEIRENDIVELFLGKHETGTMVYGCLEGSSAPFFAMILE